VDQFLRKSLIGFRTPFSETNRPAKLCYVRKKKRSELRQRGQEKMLRRIVRYGPTKEIGVGATQEYETLNLF